MNRGLFITFEGIDGCGKSTQLAEAARRLTKEGLRVVTTREPGGTPIAEKIRELIINPDHAEMHNECELLLYLASRAQHVQEKIAPALRDNSIVLCDRFQEATFAYQGYGRGFSLEKLKALNAFATGGLDPDCTFIFDISVALSRKRLAAMDKGQDRLESNPDDFYERIRNGYLAMAESQPQRIVLLDGTAGVDELSGIVAGKIRSMLVAAEKIV
jgi:dTMP kinase